MTQPSEGLSSRTRNSSLLSTMRIRRFSIKLQSNRVFEERYFVGLYENLSPRVRNISCDNPVNHVTPVPLMAKRGKLRTFLEYSAAKSVFTISVIYPRLPQWGSGGEWVPSPTGSRPICDERRRQIFASHFLKKTEEERAQLVRGCFDSLGRLMGFFSQMSSRSEEELKQLIDVQGWENLEAAKKDNGQKLVLYTGHLGAWELTSFGFSLLGHRFIFLVRRIDNPRIEQMVDRVRTRFGNETIDKLSAGREMLRSCATVRNRSDCYPT